MLQKSEFGAHESGVLHFKIVKQNHFTQSMCQN